MLEASQANAEMDRRRAREHRTDWSEADWASNLERALRPQTRQDQKGGWEYLFQGGWVPQSQWDDPMWRKNVYDPYEADVRNYWRDKQEESRKYSAGIAGRQPMAQMVGGGRGRGGGRVGSSSGRGGGGGYQMDPQMMALLGG